jgi:hypothetical protein
MVVRTLYAEVRTRTFLVTYWPDADAGAESAIKLGVFGDLRMGKRYALGLIARTKTDPEEIERVGRLARRFIENPYDALRERYEMIWKAPSAPDAFERFLGRSHSSVVFSDVSEIVGTAQVADLKDDTEVAKDWCKDELRRVIRSRFHAWMGTLGSSPKEREQVDEQDEQPPQTSQRAAG